MKMITKIAVLTSFTAFMFAGVNLTWGNTYTDDSGDVTSAAQVGVHFDVNDNTTIGWEGGLKVGLDGPAGMTMRLGYDASAPSLGVGRSWWASTGAGWGTSLNTTLDFDLTGDNAWVIGVNLSFGF